MGQAPEREDTRRGRGKFEEAGNYTFHFVLLFFAGVLTESASKRATTPTLEILVSLVCVEDERRTKGRNTVRKKR